MNSEKDERTELGTDAEKSSPKYTDDQAFRPALGLALSSSVLSASKLQKSLHIGYGKAVNLLETMTELGILTESGGKYSATELAEQICRELLHEERAPTAYMLLADGFEEVEALAVLDILRRGGVNVKTVGITDKTVTGSHGITVRTDLVPGAAGAPISMLILPGGMPGTTNLDASPETERLLTEALASGARIAAICAAPLILGKRGLLRGREAVCYPGFEGYLSGAVLAQKRVVTSDLFTTAVGMGAASEFGLELLRLLTDAETARKVAASAFIPYEG